MAKKKIYAFTLLVVLAAVLISGCSSTAKGGSEKLPKQITLDYAYYSPTSLVLKKFGWVEEAFKEKDVEVKWVLSQGSNKALQFITSGSADFTSSAGAAALMAKAKGAPIEDVYIYSKPEWTALVTTKDSPIDSVEDLKGKKIAATLGTDPYIFLLRALHTEGLTPKDVKIVNLQHGDGATALSKGEVDAWAGLDPFMAKLQLEEGAKLFFRKPDFNTYGVLNVRTAYAEKHPEVVETVIEQYEKARKWAIAHREETAQILADAAHIDLPVAKRELKRNDFSDPTPGEEQFASIVAAGKILQDVDVIDSELNVQNLTKQLLNPEYVEAVVKGAGE
ncbi:MAG TPA: aliphatic sulfonate ABC transporter substrate-binding protein [Bacillales bacterium]|nr:aliphatic sulfonate ABC transporter substrate-binding protein [Bacillales bacterium]